MSIDFSAYDGRCTFGQCPCRARAGSHFCTHHQAHLDRPHGHSFEYPIAADACPESVSVRQRIAAAAQEETI